MSEWLAVTPSLLLAVGVVLVPGLLLARCLGFGYWDAVGLGAPLGLGVLALANIAAIVVGLRWGVGILAITAIGLSTVALGARLLGRRILATDPGRRTSQPVEPVGMWGRRENVVAGLVTLAVVLIGTFAIIHGIPTPGTLNQSFDAAFHVNAIDAMVQRHSAAPSIFGQMAYPTRAGGFYPPSFDAIGALVVQITGVSAIVAGNVGAVAIAVLWPLTMSMMIRRLARPSVFGFAIAMIGTVTVLLFPVLPLRRGTIWPAALSLLCVAPQLVLMVRALGLHRSARGEDDPHGSIALPAVLAASAVILPGIVFAQPSSVFLVFDLGLLLLVWFCWRRLAKPDLSRLRRTGAGLAGIALAVGVLAVVTWLSWQVPAIASVGRFYWPTVVSVGGASLDVVRLASSYSAPNIAFAALGLVGVALGARTSRGRFLIAGWLVVGVLSVLAAAVQSSSTKYLTGFWYNNAFRLYAALPILVLPLVALGADALRSGVASLYLRIRPGATTAAPWVGASVLCAAIVAFQGGLGVQRASDTIAKIYEYKPGRLISPGEAEMFQRLGAKLPPGQRIAGSPWTGALLAGALSGRPNLFSTFSVGAGPQVLVARRFSEYQTDPDVCAAIKSLRIGIVVTGPLYRIGKPWLREPFVGFDNLGSVPGLTKIDSGGGATAYRVGPCRS